MEDIIVLASGTNEGGGSGFVKLAQHFAGNREARIVGVVSNIRGGGVEKRAHECDVPFLHLPNQQCTVEGYAAIAGYFKSTSPWYACSGWLRFIRGLDPARTFNIHPALLSKLNGRFGGKNMHGHHVHEAVKVALDAGEIEESGFSMHFVTDEYDRGPAFAEFVTALKQGMSVGDIGSAVNTLEHRWQSMLTEMVVRGQIRLEDGKVVVPPGYGLLPKNIDPRFS